MSIFKRFPALYARYKERKENQNMAAMTSVAQLLCQELDAVGAPNFYEVHFVDDSHNLTFVVTAQRAGGKTPGMRFREAMDEIDNLKALLATKDVFSGKAAIQACASHFQEAWEHGFIERPEQDMLDVTTAIRNFAETYQGGAESDWQDDDARPVPDQLYRALQSQHDDLQSMLFNVKRERDELMGLIKAVAAHSTPTLINGTRCAVFPWIEYEVVAAKAKGGAA